MLQQLLNSFNLFLQPANYFIILGGVAVEKVTCIDATKVSTRYEYLMNNLWFKKILFKLIQAVSNIKEYTKYTFFEIRLYNI